MRPGRVGLGFFLAASCIAETAGQKAMPETGVMAAVLADSEQGPAAKERAGRTAKAVYRAVRGKNPIHVRR